jgi:ribosomal protein L16 Arg81 hydroxylase
VRPPQRERRPDEICTCLAPDVPCLMHEPLYLDEAPDYEPGYTEPSTLPLGLNLEQVSPQFTEDELWNFLGLNDYQRNQVDQLMRAKAWARLADLHPASRAAVELIDTYLERLVEQEVARRTEERRRVLEACRKYQEGINSLVDLLGDLNDIAGYDPAAEE